MSHIPLVDSHMEARVEEVLDDIRDTLGVVPAIFRAYGNNSTILVAQWERYKHVMLTGSLSPKLKEGIALMVAADERSDYGIALHSAALQQLGVDPNEVLRIRTDPDHAHYDPKDHALLEVARHANSNPFDHSGQVTDDARATGASDEEIIEALAAAGLASEISHTAAFLSLPSD
ncbi:carboxymuconolactone decarboxylase family protein [uncultured Microbulbifer sp.]|uniref:carboxymuconolactone decarboxylase family protein n=1 Tax=uncultured Microbulbifer sp. TaxID=348147 RepID=UPI0026080560|nr:carboxymuconolactone decarboxylase family protein [uncultured Microbulbifer sp.]